MKTTARQGASSTHSLTMVSGSKWERFKNSELLYDRHSDNLVENNAFTLDNADDEYRYITYESFTNGGFDDYETFYSDYTTENGEKVIAFGYFGYNG